MRRMRLQFIALRHPLRSLGGRIQHPASLFELLGISTVTDCEDRFGSNGLPSAVALVPHRTGSGARNARPKLRQEATRPARKFALSHPLMPFHVTLRKWLAHPLNSRLYLDQLARSQSSGDGFGTKAALIGDRRRYAAFGHLPGAAKRLLKFSRLVSHSA